MNPDSYVFSQAIITKSSSDYLQDENRQEQPTSAFSFQKAFKH